MIGPGQFWAILIGFTILSTSLFAVEPEDEDFLKSITKPATVESVHVKVTNQYGRVLLTDFKTPTDAHIDFNLQPLPVGNYTVEVHQGNKVINTTDVRNVSFSDDVLTVEILNAKGKQVYESTNTDESFDLSSMGKGNYTVNVYQGSNLINTRILKNTAH